MVSKEVQQLAGEWLARDFHDPTKTEIEALLAAGNEGELRKRLATRIKFGTAGLRGRMQAGNAFMNHLTVTQASQGLVKTIQSVFESNPPEGVNLAVCIGRDGRHNSVDFAHLAASAFMSSGIPVYLFEGVVPTPLVVCR